MIVYRPTYKCKKTGQTKQTEHYYARHRGKRHALHVADRRVAEAKARDLIAKIELGYDPRQLDKAKKERLDDLIAEFIERLVPKSGEWHRGIVGGRLRKLTAELNANVLADLTTERIQGWLNKSKLAARTRHHYRTHLKAFGADLVKSGRTHKNPFADLEAITGIESDRKLQRRALTDDEIAKLIASVPNSKWSRCGVMPADRVWLYRTASLTGFRRDELASLTVQAFRLDATPPHIHLEADAAKNGKEAHQPIPAAFAAGLQGYLADKEVGVTIWPIAGKRTAAMIRMDLKEAGVPIAVAGRVVDFHALRTTFGTSCALKGVPLALACTLLRHSTPVLTQQIYTVAQLSDLSREVEKLG